MLRLRTASPIIHDQGRGTAAAGTLRTLRVRVTTNTRG